jgi:hypothetical protein
MREADKQLRSVVISSSFIAKVKTIVLIQNPGVVKPSLNSPTVRRERTVQQILRFHDERPSTAASDEAETS